jgi:uncharacterized membrane protein
MKNIYKIFLKGLLTILPLVVTVYLLVKLGRWLESIFAVILRFVLPAHWYIPGMGVVIGLVLVLFIGSVVEVWFARKIWSWIEEFFERIPLIKEIYGSLKQLVQYFSGGQKSGSSQVVMVNMGGNMRFLGLVTRTDFSNAPAGMATDETVAVYLPWSYQTGGFTVYIPRSKVEPINMRAEEALRWAITAGVSTKISQPDTEDKTK